MSIIEGVMRQNSFKRNSDTPEGVTASWTREVQTLSGPVAVLQVHTHSDGQAHFMAARKDNGTVMLDKTGDRSDMYSDAVVWSHTIAGM